VEWIPFRTYVSDLNRSTMVNTTDQWNNDLGEDELIPDTMLPDDDTDSEEQEEE